MQTRIWVHACLGILLGIKHHDPSHDSIASTLSYPGNLKFRHSHSGVIGPACAGEALPLQQRTLELQLRSLGDDSESLVYTRGNIAGCCMQLKVQKRTLHQNIDGTDWAQIIMGCLPPASLSLP